MSPFLPGEIGRCEVVISEGIQGCRCWEAFSSWIPASLFIAPWLAYRHKADITLKERYIGQAGRAEKKNAKARQKKN